MYIGGQRSNLKLHILLPLYFSTVHNFRLLVLKRIMKLNRIIPDWTERKSIWILGLPYILKFK